MSKCREAFISYYNFTPEQYDPEWNEWKAAWNAATKNAVEICRGHQVYSRRTGTATAAESIEREIEQ